MNQAAEPDAGAVQAQVFVHAILALLRERTGCDFSRYRAATVYRRIRNRMIALGIASLPEYLVRLESRQDEALPLLERLTIKVSRFYRNRATFDLLRAHVLPGLARARGGEPVRVWSAGCGCGEEAYTLAMLLEEAGAPGFVCASDLDPGALAAARAGLYPAEALAELPDELCRRFVEPTDAGGLARYRVRDAARARVRLVQHDLTSPAPAPGTGRFDLVCCRNVLIYLQRDQQERTLRALCGSIEPGGFLCLGEAEWPRVLAPAAVVPLGRKTHLFRVRRRSAEGVSP